MKFAIISDIHGNYEAFRKVLIDMETVDISATFCLGDCIGYGPEPEEVLDQVIQRNIPTTIGNHEMAIFNDCYLKWFNPKARASIEKTKLMLSNTSKKFIQGLPNCHNIKNYRFVHGYPPDSIRTYLFQKSLLALISTFKTMSESICFVGHTHDLEKISFDGHQIERQALKQGITQINAKYRHIINIGSVGQPRDGNNKAKYAIYDTDRHELEIRFINYDIAATAAKIKAAGLPESHAKRLW